MKEMLRCIWLPLVLFSVSGIAADVAALRNGVVKITSTSPEGKRRTGTGFIVKLEADAAFILTARHVVEGDSNPKVEFFTLPNSPVGGETVRSAGELDAALVVVRGKGNMPPRLQALSLNPKDSLVVGQDVSTIGFPPGLSWAVSKPNIASQEGAYFAVVGGNIDEGSSGGPVLKDGTVVAMVIAAERGSGRVVPAQFLAFLLQGWRVDIPPAPQPIAGGPTPAPERHAQPDFLKCHEVPSPATEGVSGRPSAIDFSPACSAVLDFSDRYTLKVQHRGATRATFRYHADSAWKAGNAFDISIPGKIQGDYITAEFPYRAPGASSDYVYWFVDLSNDNGQTTPPQMMFIVSMSTPPPKAGSVSAQVGNTAGPGLTGQEVAQALGPATEGARLNAIQRMANQGNIRSPLSADEVAQILEGTTGSARAQGVAALAKLIKSNLSGKETATLLGTPKQLNQGSRLVAIEALARTSRLGPNGEDSALLLRGTTGSARAQSIAAIANSLKSNLSGQEAAAILGSKKELNEGSRLVAIHALAAAQKLRNSLSGDELTAILDGTTGSARAQALGDLTRKR